MQDDDRLAWASEESKIGGANQRAQLVALIDIAHSLRSIAASLELR